jgi:GAF domain
LAATSPRLDMFIPLPGSTSHVTLQATQHPFRKEVICMDSSGPAEESATQSADDRLSALLYLSQQLNAERDLPKLLDLMAREVARLLAAERASVFLWDRATDELWSLVALGSEPLRFDARRGLAGVVVQQGITINVPDVQQEPRFYPGAFPDC